MHKTEDEKVQKYLNEIERVAAERSNTLIEMREIVLSICPRADEKIMYGGLVFFFDGEMFAGLFLNKHHVTLEFSKGFIMKDPHGFLEGTGKYRRHLKIKTMEDVIKKDVRFFVKQAV